MEIVGSVRRDEVPEASRPERPLSPYRELALKAVEDYQREQVTVVKVRDEKELKSFRNNIAYPLRTLGYKPRLVVHREGNEIRIYVNITPRETESESPSNSVDKTFSLGRPRHR